VEASSGLERKARLSTLPLTCVLIPLSDIKVRRFWSSQSVKGSASSEVRLVYGSYLGYRRLKSPARKVEERRFRGRLRRFVIMSPEPALPGGALYTLIIVSTKELRAWIYRIIKSRVIIGRSWSAYSPEPLWT
jgi:hypothetical protein